jgi:hypothetical protein
MKDKQRYKLEERNQEKEAGPQELEKVKNLAGRRESILETNLRNGPQDGPVRVGVEGDGAARPTCTSSASNPVDIAHLKLRRH